MTAILRELKLLPSHPLVPPLLMSLVAQSLASPWQTLNPLNKLVRVAQADNGRVKPGLQA